MSEAPHDLAAISSTPSSHDNPLPAEETQEQVSLDSTPKGLVLLYTFGGAIVYVIALVRAQSKESYWAAGLFGIPVFAQLVGALFHERFPQERQTRNRFFYDFSMKWSSVYIAIVCVLWVIYSTDYRFYWVCSWLALLAVASIVFLVGYMMCAFLHEPKKSQNLIKLKKGASSEPLWALSFLFFVIFLDVAYLFGFALAFHDQYCLKATNIPALHMLNVTSPEDNEASRKPEAATNVDGSSSPKTSVPGNSDAAQTQAKSKTEDTEFYFYFESLHANLLIKKPEAFDCVPTIQGGIKTRPPQRLMHGLSPTEEFNYCALQAIKELIDQEALEGRRTRVVLIGRSDDNPVKEATKNKPDDKLVDYKSNYELSEARVERVRYEITEALKSSDSDPQSPDKWHNLEWLSRPSSNEDSDKPDEILDKIIEKMPEPQQQKLKDENKRVVMASVVSIPGDLTSLQMKRLKRDDPRPMKLMDYMYFSIYTITTTGYGDIIPTTAYSKFVISLANICEVLFLVVFFNALVSLRKDPLPPDVNGH